MDSNGCTIACPVTSNHVENLTEYQTLASTNAPWSLAMNHPLLSLFRSLFKFSLYLYLHSFHNPLLHSLREMLERAPLFHCPLSANFPVTSVFYLQVFLSKFLRSRTVSLLISHTTSPTLHRLIPTHPHPKHIRQARIQTRTKTAQRTAGTEAKPSRCSSTRP